MERIEFDEFYAKNVGLIHTVARKAATRAAGIGSSLEYEDFQQELTEVFIRAFDNYDPSQFKFSTYYMRSAFNRVNYLLERVERERIDNQTYSVEEMAGWSPNQDEGELGVSVEDVTSMRPDEVAQLKSLMRTWSKTLSPMAQVILSWTIEPPEWLEQEFAAQQAHADYARSVNIPRRARIELDASYVAGVLKQLTGKTKCVIDALAEVKHVAKNTL